MSDNNENNIKINDENIKSTEILEDLLEKNISTEVKKKIEKQGTNSFLQSEKLSKPDTPDISGKREFEQFIINEELNRKRADDRKYKNNLENKIISNQKLSLNPKRQLSNFVVYKDSALDQMKSEYEEDLNEAGQKDEDDKTGQNVSPIEQNQKSNLVSDKIKSKNLTTKLKNQADSKVNRLRLLTDTILKFMIRVVIPSWSLSMFYVYAHVLLSVIFKKYFCSLGHEWVPDEIKKMSPDLAKKTGDMIGIAEKPAVGCCCSCHLAIVIIIVAIIYFIVRWWVVLWDWFAGLLPVWQN